MAIEFNCDKCQHRLRVPDEHAGKKARCPTCQAVNMIPAQSAPAPKASTGSPPVSNPFGGSITPSASDSAASLNPYASSSTGQGSTASQNSNSLEEFRPLYEALFHMKFLAWTLIGVGVIYCLTIVGIIFAWVPIWMGLCLKKSNESFAAAFERGDRAALTQASKSLRTFFKIAGVWAMVSVGFMLLYIVVIILAVVFGTIAG